MKMMFWQLSLLLCLVGGAFADKSLVFESEKKETWHEQEDKKVPDELPFAACKNPKYSCGPGINSTCCFKNPATAPKCCPYFEGVCCADFVHCCPRGAHCDMIYKRCFQTSDTGLESFPMTKSYPALEEMSETKSYPALEEMSEAKKLTEKEDLTDPNVINIKKAVMCPDSSVECPDGETCCHTANSSYKCCQYTMAVCCSDGLHCCPKDYKCDLVANRCVGKHYPKLGFFNWILQPSLPLE